LATATGRPEAEPPHPIVPNIEAANSKQQVLDPQKTTIASSFILRQRKLGALCLSQTNAREGISG
jgi:hypothetical protein